MGEGSSLFGSHDPKALPPESRALLLAALLLENGEFAKALKSLERVFPATGTIEEVSLLKGIAHFGLGEYDEARPLFEQTLETSVRRLTRSSALLYLSQIVEEGGDPAYGETLRSESFEVCPDERPTLSLSRALAHQGEIAQALRVTRSFLSFQPGSCVLREREVRLLLRLNRLEDAVSVYESWVRSGSAEACGPTVKLLGSELEIRRGDHDASTLLSEGVVENATQLAEAYYWLGCADFQQRSFDSALSLIDAAIELCPKAGLYHVKRGAALSAMGRKEDALEAYDQASSLGYFGADLPLYRAFALEDLGRREESIAAARKAMEQDPRLHLGYYFLACLMARSGDSRQCLQYLRQAVALSPEYRGKAQTNPDFDHLRESGKLKEILHP